MNAFMLYRGLKRQGIYHHLDGWGKLSFQVLVSNGVMAAFLLYLSPPVNTWLNWSIIDRIPSLLGFVFIAMLLYLLSLFICGFRPRQLKH